MPPFSWSLIRLFMVATCAVAVTYGGEPHGTDRGLQSGQMSPIESLRRAMPAVLFQSLEAAEPEFLPDRQDGDIAAPGPNAAGNPFDNDPTLNLPSSRTQERQAEPGTWNEAGLDQEQVSDVIRAHWVRLDPRGGIGGRISTFDPDLRLAPVEGLRVRLIQDGQTLVETQTDPQGSFYLPGVPPGVHTLVGAGSRGFMAYGVIVLSADAPDAGDGAMSEISDPFRLVQFEEVEETLAFDIAAVPPTFNTLKRLAAQYYPEMAKGELDNQAFANAVREDVESGASGADEPEGPAGRRGLTPLTKKPPISRAATSVRQHAVWLSGDGKMLGRLHGIDRLTGRPKMIDDVNVFLLQDDAVVRQGEVDKLGVFEFEDLTPGAYSLVAAGEDGFGATGFQLVQAAGGEEDAVGRRSGLDFIRPVSHTRDRWFRLVQGNVPANLPFPFAMALIDDPQDLQAALSPQAFPGIPQLADAPLAPQAMPAPPAPPAPPAGAPGGPMGPAQGGMASGGPGGIGAGLVGLAALAALPIPFLIDDDEPVSPFTASPPSPPMETP